MTEQEWLVCIDSVAMLTHLFAGKTASPETRRRQRLFIAACARLQNGYSIGEWQREIETSDGTRCPDIVDVWALSMSWAQYNKSQQMTPEDRAAAVRCIMGSPFKSVSLCGNPDHGSVSIRPHCPACRRILAPDVAMLAKAAHAERNPDGTLDNARLAVLSDALEEAGCESPNALTSHLRSGGRHWMGCYALDICRGVK